MSWGLWVLGCSELVAQHHLVPTEGSPHSSGGRAVPQHLNPPLLPLPSGSSQTLFSSTADVANPSAITDAAKIVEGKLNGMGLNLLINNAGIYTPAASLQTVDAEEMIRTYKTNAVGPMLMAQAFLPLLKKAARESTEKGLSCSKAAIINISTIMGSIEKTSESFYKPVISYRCSKAALNMLTKCQALTYGEAGILCVALHPGWVKTDMGSQEADLTVDTSVRGLLSVLPILSEKHSGTLLNWEGKAIPW
uniref:C-factor n=1 Tax=Athene cunicularia TaxID=194338 RepID=A0A663MR84_ATHCN